MVSCSKLCAHEIEIMEHDEIDIDRYRNFVNHEVEYTVSQTLWYQLNRIHNKKYSGILTDVVFRNGKHLAIIKRLRRSFDSRVRAKTYKKKIIDTVILSRVELSQQIVSHTGAQDGPYVVQEHAGNPSSHNRQPDFIGWNFSSKILHYKSVRYETTEINELKVGDQVECRDQKPPPMIGTVKWIGMRPLDNNSVEYVAVVQFEQPTEQYPGYIKGPPHNCNLINVRHLEHVPSCGKNTVVDANPTAPPTVGNKKGGHHTRPQRHTNTHKSDVTLTDKSKDGQEYGGGLSETASINFHDGPKQCTVTAGDAPCPKIQAEQSNELPIPSSPVNQSQNIIKPDENNNQKLRHNKTEVDIPLQQIGDPMEIAGDDDSVPSNQISLQPENDKGVFQPIESNTDQKENQNDDQMIPYAEITSENKEDDLMSSNVVKGTLLDSTNSPKDDTKLIKPKSVSTQAEAFYLAVQNAYKPAQKFGIQGLNNSCYMDASIYSLFVFGKLLDAHLCKEIGNPKFAQVQSRLKSVVKELRKHHYVSNKRMKKLRYELVENKGPQYEHDYMDAEEFLVDLFRLLDITGLFTYDHGEADYIHQILLPVTWEENQKKDYLTLQNLLEQSFAASEVKLLEMPPSAFIIKLPVSDGKLIPCNGVIPNVTLDFTNILYADKEDVKRATMRLSAVICLRSCHFVTFVCLDPMNDASRWVFVDSQPTLQEPQVHFLEKMTEGIREAERSSDKKSIRIHEPKCGGYKLFRDAYICVYTPVGETDS